MYEMPFIMDGSGANANNILTHGVGVLFGLNIIIGRTGINDVVLTMERGIPGYELPLPKFYPHTNPRLVRLRQ